MSAASSPLRPWQVLCAGVSALVLTLGLARFAYTPLLPLMHAEAGLGDALGGWLATVNYAGYMSGTLLAMAMSHWRLRRDAYRAGLVAGVIGTAGMGFTTDPLLWMVLRYIAGVSAASGMILGSGMVLSWLLSRGRRPELGLHFIGMGLGIIVSGVLVAMMSTRLGWAQQWVIMGGIGALLVIPAWMWMPSVETRLQTGAPGPGTHRAARPLLVGTVLLNAAYGCAGVGYVTSATFLVIVAQRDPAVGGSAALVWIVAGLAATPASFFWDRLARRIGEIWTLLIAYAAQILSIILPLASTGFAATLIGAFLFGATFIGIVSVTFALAGRRNPDNPAKAMARLTLTYGTANIVVPTMVGVLAEYTGSYGIGLGMAAVAMAVGMVLLAIFKGTTMPSTRMPRPADSARWRVLAGVSAGVVLSMTTWFSATAIGPDLTRAFTLTPAAASWLTNMVQLGFVAGALASSVVSLPDLVPLRYLMGIAGALAAAANLSLLWVHGVDGLLAARFVTGVALAGIYPPAMKLIATWFVHGRGLALGVVIGALTLGSASPNLVRAVLHGLPWQDVVVAASAATLLGAGVLLLVARDGPFPFSKAIFDPRQVVAVFRNRPLVLANLGYFGHMWELYAMWGWFLVFTLAAPTALGFADGRGASMMTFCVIAIGSVGAVLGGYLADRIGRTATAAMMMAVSGLCAIAIGFTVAGPVWLFLLVALIWGISIVGDSAQFSAMATEVSDPRYVGTAIALQLGIGFALTMISIRLTPVFASVVGWRWSFLLLMPGPVIGVMAMIALRRHPEAGRIAHGLR